MISLSGTTTRYFPEIHHDCLSVRVEGKITAPEELEIQLKTGKEFSKSKLIHWKIEFIFIEKIGYYEKFYDAVHFSSPKVNCFIYPNSEKIRDIINLFYSKPQRDFDFYFKTNTRVHKSKFEISTERYNSVVSSFPTPFIDNTNYDDKTRSGFEEFLIKSYRFFEPQIEVF